MILLRATVRLIEGDDVEEDEDRRLCGVSVPGELGTESGERSSSFRSKQMNCTSPVSEEMSATLSMRRATTSLTRIVQQRLKPVQ